MYETKAAITHQRNSRLLWDIQTLLPKLHGIRLNLKELGPDLLPDSRLEEFFGLMGDILDLRRFQTIHPNERSVVCESIEQVRLYWVFQDI